MAREASLTDKDMRVLQETMKFSRALEQDNAVIKDYNGEALVILEWNLNPEANRERIFRIRINDEEALIDLEELLSYTRII
jgi:hypothetical protein